MWSKQMMTVGLCTSELECTAELIMVTAVRGRASNQACMYERVRQLLKLLLLHVVVNGRFVLCLCGNWCASMSHSPTQICAGDGTWLAAMGLLWGSCYGGRGCYVGSCYGGRML